MTPITYPEFLHHLESFGTAVHWEMYANNYIRCYGADAPDRKVYYDCGCAVLVDDFELDGRLWVWRAIHQVAPDAGIEAVASYEKSIDLAWLKCIHIAPAYRQRGFGKRHVLTTLADYPDKKWHYQVARDNSPSVALARSL